MTRLERMEASIVTYKAKIVEMEAKIEKEREALIAKRSEAEAKIREAAEKFAKIYGGLPDATAILGAAEEKNEEDASENANPENTLFN